jgi:hypothetical protein
MGAFIVAGLIFAATVFISIVVLFADGMSDTRGDGGTSAGWVFGSSTVISALVLGNHWSHIGW